MSITKLMADPIAAQIYADLDTRTHPRTLADNYLQAKLAGNVSECLALECSIRDLARIHFNRAEVLDALRAMERHKAMRKLGTGAPKMLQEIADTIDADYAAGNYVRLADNMIEFCVGNLKVRCKNLPGAVALVSAKYRRGIGKSRAARYGSCNA